MLEGVSNILNNGEVPNLLDKLKVKVPTEGPIAISSFTEKKKDESPR